MMPPRTLHGNLGMILRLIDELIREFDESSTNLSG